jgi:hypothetical protein
MYRLVVLHRDDAWAAEVETEVRAVVRRTLQRGDVLEVCSLDDARNDPVSPAAVLFLASEEARDDPDIQTALDEARAAAFAVVPIGRQEAGLHELLPGSIGRLNAIIWDGSRNQAVQIARLLGIVESERKLFLSYRRHESEDLALQLRRALSERGYDVFLDRFSVPPGADFQDRLDAELADKAFVLLLESASAVGSDWVQHEVSYALAHHIAVLALSLPDADPDGRFAVVDDAFRLPVETRDVTDGPGPDRRLTDDALRRVLDEVELQAARQLRRRREQLLGGLSDFLFTAGARRTEVDSWGILAERDGHAPEVFLVTPRAPTPFDVCSVDILRDATGFPDCGGRVVHDVSDRDLEVRNLIDWIVAGRPLSVISLLDLADELTP